MWNGLVVRRDFWEPRHPQDFIPSVRERDNSLDLRSERGDPPNEFPPVTADDLI